MGENVGMKFDRRQIVNNVVDEILAQKTYGDILEFEELENWFECERRANAGLFLYYMSQIKALLVRKGYVLESILDVGYRILYPNEVAEHVVNTSLRKIINNIEVARNKMEFTDRGLLDARELDLHQRIENIVQELEKHNKDTMFTAQVLIAKAQQKEIEG